LHQFFTAFGLADGSATVRRLCHARRCGARVRRWARVAPAPRVRRGDGGLWVPLGVWGLAASPCSSCSPWVARAFGGDAAGAQPRPPPIAGPAAPQPASRALLR